MAVCALAREARSVLEGRLLPGWAVRISSVDVSVASLMDAWMVSMPSSTVIARLGSSLVTAVSGRSAWLRDVARRRRSSISRDTGCSRWARAAEGGTGRIHRSSHGSGWSRAMSMRQGTAPSSARATRPVCRASRYRRNAGSHTSVFACGWGVSMPSVPIGTPLLCALQQVDGGTTVGVRGILYASREPGTSSTCTGVAVLSPCCAVTPVPLGGRFGQESDSRIPDRAIR